VPARFGDYELLEEIARGGMGIVYKARQVSLNRLVAVKMILSGQFASKQEVLRFRVEAEAAANLRHPNIVAIYETGEHQGQHFFSMEYVPGPNLAQLVGNRPLNAQPAARYTLAIARAIHYAHGQNTLHRDLKPSNVLVDADDQPRITDFGLMRRLRGPYGLTVTGQMLGSPNFMPPEQCGWGSSRREEAHFDKSEIRNPKSEIPGRPVERRIWHRRDPLSPAHGPASVPSRDSSGRAPSTARAGPRSSVSAEPEHPARPGNHLPQVPGEGAEPTLRHGARTRRRP
jgi:serine/threonine protein kinase